MDLDIRLRFPRSKDRGPIEACRCGFCVICGGCGFRGRKIAAPLKPKKRGRDAWNRTRFRGRKIAAPLKPLPSAAVFAVNWQFPRSKDRGPIEATDDRIIARIVSKFPRSEDRGPIEALIDCGYISLRDCFRGRKIAAPLKH